jgi:hypothetical protein
MRLELTHADRLTVIEVAKQTGVITIHSALQAIDGEDRLPIIIRLTEHVEVIVPQISNPDQRLNGTNERAVARVELLDGEVQALLWDHAAVEHDTEPQVMRLTPAGAAQCVSQSSITPTSK